MAAYSQYLIPFVKKLEGFVGSVRPCPAGIPTGGWGHTGSDVRLGMAVSLAQGEKWLASDLAKSLAAVTAILNKHKITATQSQIDALVSFDFNVGEGALAGSSIIKWMARGNTTMAAQSFLAWNKAHVRGQLVALAGLTRRREAERAMFLGDISSAMALAGVAASSPMPQAVAAPKKPEALAKSPTVIASGVTTVGGAATAALGVANSLNENADKAVAAAQHAKETVTNAASIFGVSLTTMLIVIGVAVLIAGAVVAFRRWRQWHYNDLVTPAEADIQEDDNALTAAADTAVEGFVEFRDVLARAVHPDPAGAAGGGDVGIAPGGDASPAAA